jgi:hypothetical protein
VLALYQLLRMRTKAGWHDAFCKPRNPYDLLLLDLRLLVPFGISDDVALQVPVQSSQASASLPHAFAFHLRRKTQGDAP